MGTGIDTLRANVELQNEKQRLLKPQTQQKVALYGLARLLDLDPIEKSNWRTRRVSMRPRRSMPTEALSRPTRLGRK